jgi:hypothetical protein
MISTSQEIALRRTMPIASFHEKQFHNMKTKHQPIDE